MIEVGDAEDAEILVIAYGSVARSAQRAVKEARERASRPDFCIGYPVALSGRRWSHCCARSGRWLCRR